MLKMKREFDSILDIPQVNPLEFFPNCIDVKNEGWSLDEDWVKRVFDQELNEEAIINHEEGWLGTTIFDEVKEVIHESEKGSTLEKSSLSTKNDRVEAKSINPYKDYVSPPRRRRRKEEIRVPDDGYLWLKYGQKDLMGSSYTRAYYRCKEKEKGCPAKRTVDRQRSDTSIMQIVYEEDHNHLPTHAISDQTNSKSASGFSPKSVQSGSSVVTLDSPQSVTFRRNAACFEDPSSVEVTKGTTVSDEPEPSVIDTILLKPMNQVLPKVGFSNKPTWTSFNPNGSNHYISQEATQVKECVNTSNLVGFQSPQFQADYLKLLLQARSEPNYASEGGSGVTSNSSVLSPKEVLLELLRNSNVFNLDRNVNVKTLTACESNSRTLQLAPPIQSNPFYEKQQNLYPAPVSHVEGSKSSSFDPFSFLGGGDTFRLADFMTN